MKMMNRMVRWYLKKWDTELSSVINNCTEVQQKQLLNILKSPYVKYFYPERDFHSYPEFRDRLPIISYDSIRHKIHNLKTDDQIKCEYFAQSSGTTSGEKKLIPTPEFFVRKNHLRGSWYILHTLYNHAPDMSVFRARNLLIGGSIYVKEKDYLIGDVSGIMLNRIPIFFRPWYVPSINIAVHPNWEYKINKTIEAAVKTKNVTLLGGLPTWVLSACRSILEKSEEEYLSDLWPNLKAYIHGGVSFSPYKDQFEELIKISNFRYIEVYNASEGFFAYQDIPGQEGMLLMCASEIFFEFIELTSYRRGFKDAMPIGDVALGVDYVIVITTSSGLVRYVLGDIVTFVNINPYRIKVLGRINEYINAFGEDMMLFHVEEALKIINKKFEVNIRNYSVAPSYLTISSKGFHQWYVEFDNPPADLSLYARELDHLLQEINSNYAQKRSNDLALDNLEIIKLPPNTVQRYFENYASPGGQNKLPKLRNDRKIADRFVELIESYNQEILTS